MYKEPPPRGEIREAEHPQQSCLWCRFVDLGDHNSKMRCPKRGNVRVSKETVCDDWRYAA